MHRKLIDTLELIIKKKTEEIVNKGQNKKAKSNRPQQKTKDKIKKQSPSTEDDCFLVLSKMRTIVLRPCQPQLA